MLERLEKVKNEITIIDLKVNKLSNLVYENFSTYKTSEANSLNYEDFDTYRENKINELMDERELLFKEKIKLEGRVRND